MTRFYLDGQEIDPQDSKFYVECVEPEDLIAQWPHIDELIKEIQYDQD